VLVDGHLFPELTALTGDIGARAVLARHAGATIAVECGPEVLIDIDTPDDYARLKQRLRTDRAPS
jgi:molybdenum cofactor cytidylyltransferase